MTLPAFSILVFALHSITMAQIQTPNIEAQRTAMKKLSFLIGEWSGEASLTRGPGIVVELSQTEVAEFKLDGLVLMVEGIGRTKSDGRVALQALGLITFDDATGTYRGADTTTAGGWRARSSCVTMGKCVGDLRSARSVRNLLCGSTKRGNGPNLLS